MEERVAWITGGGSGIGRELALRLASHGWRVAVSGRRAEPLEEVVRLGTGDRIRAWPLDATDRTANREVVEAIERDMGPISLAVLNAGAFRPFKATEFDATPFEDLFRVNFMGVVYGIEAVLPSMQARGAGHVAIMSSLSGYRGVPLGGPYAATKAALINLAESLYFDFRRMGLKLSLVNPGFIRTPLTAKNRFPMPFLMDVEEAAARIERGLEKGKFEIAFPRRMAWLLKLFRVLPYRLYFPLMRAFTGSH